MEWVSSAFTFPIMKNRGARTALKRPKKAETAAGAQTRGSVRTVCGGGGGCRSGAMNAERGSVREILQFFGPVSRRAKMLGMRRSFMMGEFARGVYWDGILFETGFCDQARRPGGP